MGRLGQPISQVEPARSQRPMEKLQTRPHPHRHPVPHGQRQRLHLLPKLPRPECRRNGAPRSGMGGQTRSAGCIGYCGQTARRTHSKHCMEQPQHPSSRCRIPLSAKQRHCRPRRAFPRPYQYLQRQRTARYPDVRPPEPHHQPPGDRHAGR